MGLDITSDDGEVEIWHGAYITFTRYRIQVAEIFGVNE